MKSTAIEIKEALLKVGISVEGIWDLVNTKKPYPEAVPVLINFLQTEIMDDRTREGIIRSLAVKEAKGKIGKILIDEFEKTPKTKEALRWAIGNTMSVVIVASDLDGVLEIVKNKENGKARQMFVFALGKMKRDAIENTLIDLLDDNDVVLHALSSLGRLKSSNAKEKIRQLFDHPNPFVGKNAKKILSKLK